MQVNHGTEGGFESEINVTPLVDVVLVLLIIFMVMIPLTLQGYDVDIPTVSTAAPTSTERPPQIVLEISATDCPVLTSMTGPGLPDGCRVRIDDEALAVNELSGRIAQLFADRRGADRVLFLAAHDRINYEAVMRIVDAARSEVTDLKIGLSVDAS